MSVVDERLRWAKAIRVVELQKRSCPMEREIGRFAELFDWLDNLQQRTPSSYCLTAENGSGLLFGTGESFSYANYTSMTEGLPCLLAVAPKRICHQEFAIFQLLDRPQKTPWRYCISNEALRKIIRDFFATGGPSDAVRWDDMDAPEAHAFFKTWVEENP
jgi:hypothetical protein